jgi:hypothetical protein
MAYWSKFYIAGQLIGTSGVDSVDIKITIENHVPFAILQQTATGIVIAASVDRLEEINHHIVYEAEFNTDDLAMLARDNALRTLFADGHVLGAYLGNNEVLGNWYNIMGFAGGIIPHLDHQLMQLSSWKPGELFNDLRPVRNDVVLTVDAVEGLVSRENLIYKMEIKKPVFPGSATLEIVDTLEGTEAPPRIENGVTYMDGWQPEIGWYLDGCLDWSLPEGENNRIQVQSKATMPFAISTWAEQNGVEIVGSRSAAMTLWGIKAKINEEDFANWNSRIFSKYVGENGRWLTWQPNNMEVDVDTPVFLSFLLNRKPTPIRVGLMVQVFDEDGSYVFFQHSELYDLPENAVLNVPMGFKQLGLHMAIPTLNVLLNMVAVKNWTVWLVDETFRRISRKRNFIMDKSRRRNVRNIVFQNSFGGIDSCRLTGVMQENLIISAQMQARGLASSYKTSDEENFVRNKKGELQVELNTGKVPRLWQEYFEELSWAERVLLQTKAGFVALTSEKNSYALPTTDSFLENRSFVFKKSKGSVGFSKMPLGLTDGEERPTAWLAVQPYCLSDTSNGFRTGMLAFNSLKLHYIDVSPPEPARGVAAKPNEIGGVDYVPPINSATCVVGTAAYESEELILESTYSKDDCGNGYKGTTWMINVDPGEFGGENQEAANARALEEYYRRNTQANANLPGNGSCILLQAGLDAEYRNYSAVMVNDPDAIFALAAGAVRVDEHIHNPQTYLPPGILGHYCAIEHNGFLKSDWTGNVVLGLEHLSGVRLWVDDVLVVNNWLGSGVSECVVPMVAGKYYKIKVQWGYQTGLTLYILKWRLSGGDTYLVPAYSCFR